MVFFKTKAPSRIPLEIQHNLQTLQVYIHYRIAIGGLLFLMFLLGLTTTGVGRYEPQLYLWVSAFYFFSCIATRFIFSPEGLVRSFKRISLLLIIDASCLLIMAHASGGVESGIVFLLVLTSAVISIFIRGKLALAFSASIVVLVIADTLFLFLDSQDLFRRLFSAGTLGALQLTTAVAFNFLTEKIRRNANEAEAQERRVRNLRDIAQNIVTRMQTGVVVISDETNVELMNDSARQLLRINIPDDNQPCRVDDFPVLQHILGLWRDLPLGGQTLIYKIRPELEVRVNFAHFDASPSPRLIAYIEDYYAIKQYAQQLKLASLGRLSASIAHEIRNPLGALSHATQLLSESPQLDGSDKRMIEIILKNSARVNDIINNTLAISRRQEPKPEALELDSWVRQFAHEYSQAYAGNIELSIESNSAIARCDPSQLRQVLTNLIENGQRYSKLKTGQAKVLLRLGVSSIDDKSFIEVIDFGDGISEEDLQNIYEPFYTTDERGTGLGLYICKELCEMNHATLHYRRDHEMRSCFRVDFSHHQRMR